MSPFNVLVLLGLFSNFFNLLSLVASSDTEPVRVGVIVDGNSEVGNISLRFMKLALLDFYKANAYYNTRLELYFRDAGSDVVAAATAAIDLMENEEVHAIIGPLWSSQAKFVVELGAKAKVPIISFSATSPSLSPIHNPYFVRTTQVRAIAAVVQAFDWGEVALIYEDTDYGNALSPYLTDAFQQLDIRVPYRSVICPTSPSLDVDILKALNTLMRKQTRVFVVHMTASLGSRFFVHANTAGMVNEEFAWIVTDGLSSLLDPVSSEAISSMEGVVGVRPYVAMSRELEDFKKRWTNPAGEIQTNGRTKFNLFGLWAYDTVFALANVVEKSWTISRPFKQNYLKRNSTSQNYLKFSDIGISEVGPKIQEGIREFKLHDHGLSGDFELVHGQLKPAAFEVFNVVEKEESVIGYWTPQYGLSKDIDVKEHEEYSTSKEYLQRPMWPGRTRKIPKGWVMPMKGEKEMKIGVPVTGGFQEFFKIEWDQYTDEPSYSGFSLDVFLAVLDELPFALPYKFVPFMNKSRRSKGTYDEMLYQINQQKVDAVVGDTTIIANRSKYVDFTLPYSESGVTMLVAIKDNERMNMWIFLKPLRWDLWLTTGLAFLFTAFVVWFLESPKNNKFNEGSLFQQLSLSIWFSFSTMVFAQKEKIHSNWTRLFLVIWMFAVLILAQSYTANLASFLTVQRLQPRFIEVEELKRNGYYVGYQKRSFVKDVILVGALGFKESLLIPYETPEDYHDALTKGSNNGGVAAIFDEIPYIKIFLAKYCNKFTMVGPTYKTDGFGFAFPINSPLTPYISRAILTVTQDKKKMDEIEYRNNLTRSPSCGHQLDSEGETIISDNNSLSVWSFGGLFIIVGLVSLFSLLGQLVCSYLNAALLNIKNQLRQFSLRLLGRTDVIPRAIT